MKKRLNLEVEVKNKKTLPAIKKSQSIYASPTHVPKLQSSQNLLSPEKNDSKERVSDRSDDLMIRRLDENTRKTVKHNSMSTPAFIQSKKHDQPLHFELSKRSTEEEIKTKPENFDYLIETISSSNKKSESEQKRDFTKRNKYKDFEIFASRQKNSELMSYVDSLLEEINSLKQANHILTENFSKVSQNLRDVELALKSSQELQKLTEAKLFQSQTEVAFKQAEISEMQDLVRRTEDKRKIANEQMSNVETKLTTFQKQIVRYHKTNVELQNELKDSNETLKFKDELIEKLYLQITDLEKQVESVKSQTVKDQVEYEKTKGLLQEEIDQLSHKVHDLEKDNRRCAENVFEMQETLKRSKPSITIIKRSESLVDSNFLNGITQEEASRWHARYFNLEQELALYKEQLGKLQKNESYYKGQIEQKNQMIEKMEFILKNQENLKKTETKPDFSPHFFNSEELHLAEILLGRVRAAEEHFKCENCFKFSKNNKICVPCAHLTCDVCQEECSALCGKCAEKIEKIIVFENLERLAEFYLSHLEGIEKLRDFLKNSCTQGSVVV